MMKFWSFLRPRSPLAVFMCRLVIILGLLSIPWQGPTQAYVDEIQEIIQTFYCADDARHTITVEPLTDDPQHPYSLRIVIVNCALMNFDGSGPIRNVDLDVCGGVPCGLLIALILATPISWSRRGWALLWGVPVTYLIGFLFLDFCIWDESSEIGLINFTPWQKEFVQIMRDLLTVQIGLSVPILVWIATTFRVEDFTGRFNLEYQLTKATFSAYPKL